MRQAFRCVAVALKSLDGFRYPKIRHSLKAFEGGRRISEMLDAFRYR